MNVGVMAGKNGVVIPSAAASKVFTVVAVLLLLLTGDLKAASGESPSGWRVAVATAKVTPTEPMAMAGYAQRRQASTGVLRDLFAKVLVLEHAAGGRMVVLTMDQHMVPGELRDYVAREAGTRYRLNPEEILLNASHTHCGPELRTDARFFDQAGKELRDPAVRYRRWLENRLVDLIGEALSRLGPARVEQSLGRAGFAMNRRRPSPEGQIALAAYPYGPVDHDVPVLKVTTPQGKLIAVLFGYACHNTTFGGDEYRINGDFAGFAQDNLEATFDGATALFLLGCAGDQDPQPRVNSVPDQSPTQLARQHGRALSNAVTIALAAGLKAVGGPIKSVLGHADIPYQTLKREEVEARLAREQLPAVREHMRKTLAQIEEGSIKKTHAWPIQVVKFGNDLLLVALAGEPVVDYALRLKRELAGAAQTWIAGYSNDGYLYLGTRRVIEEGGYEGYSANLRMLNNPGPFAASAEEIIFRRVHELCAQLEQ